MKGKTKSEMEDLLRSEATEKVPVLELVAQESLQKKLSESQACDAA